MHVTGAALHDARLGCSRKALARVSHRRLRIALQRCCSACVRCTAFEAEREQRYMKILNERADLISSIERLTEQNGELKMLLNEYAVAMSKSSRPRSISLGAS